MIGEVDIDPASNLRNHIKARVHVRQELGGDGLKGPSAGWFQAETKLPDCRWEMKPWCYKVPATAVLWCNPPYARGEVIKWIQHYRHTRYCFLLRWDPRTKWFGELIGSTTHVWFPQPVGDGTGNTVDNHPGRIEFEPPPGVTFSSNPFPHALYLRDPNPGLLERLAPHGLILRPDVIYRDGEPH